MHRRPDQLTPLADNLPLEHLSPHEQAVRMNVEV
jgi:hypothetical protein